jgi:hypothetical protein
MTPSKVSPVVTKRQSAMSSLRASAVLAKAGIIVLRVPIRLSAVRARPLAFRSLDPFRALREPDCRRRHEKRPFALRTKTVSTTQNNRLTGKAPSRVRSYGWQKGEYGKHASFVPVLIMPSVSRVNAPTAAAC